MDDGRSNDRRMTEGDHVPFFKTFLIDPTGNPLDDVDNRFPPVRRGTGVGDPGRHGDRFIRLDVDEAMTRPSPVVAVAKPGIHCNRDRKHHSGGCVARTSLRRCPSAIDRVDLRGKVLNRMRQRRIEGLIPRKSGHAYGSRRSMANQQQARKHGAERSCTEAASSKAVLNLTE